MIGDPLLSICIATMNRHEVFGETLACLAAQVTPGVEVVVIDSSAGPETESLVGEYAPRLPRLRYRHVKRGGVDRDYCLSVAASRGKYCWLFTDDDVILPGGVAAVLQALENDPDCVIVNGQIRDPALQAVLEDRRLPLQADRRFAPEQFDEFAHLCLVYLSFIGAVVVRRTLWDERDKESYFDTEFVHVGVLFQRPFAREAHVVAVPYILLRYGVAQWTRRAFKVWMINWPRLIWGLAGISERTKAAVTAREPWRSYKNLVILRAKDAFSLREYSEWLRPFELPLVLRAGMLVLCCIPYWAVNLAAQLYVRVKRPEARPLILDLVNALR